MTGKHMTGKHRRSVPEVLYGDLPSVARCICSGPDELCPRHTPGDWADCMAVHATDSVSGNHGQRFSGSLQVSL